MYDNRLNLSQQVMDETRRYFAERVYTRSFHETFD